MKVNEINFLLSRIYERTHRQVLDLDVQIENHKPAEELPILKINGFTRSYYIKQLAQEALKHLRGKYLIDNQIVVEN